MARGQDDGALGLSTEGAFHSPAQLRDVLENLPDLVLVLDRKGRIRYVNHDSPGADVQALLGVQGLRHIAAEFRDLCRTAFRSALARRQVQAFEFRDVRGHWWETRLVPVVREHEAVAIGICADITARKEAEETLRESGARLLSLLENIPDYVMVVNRQGEITFVNRAWPPHSLVDLIGTCHFDYIAPSHREVYRRACRRAFSTQKPQILEVLSAFGQWWDVHLVPLTEYGADHSLMAIAADVTERKRSAEVLRESEQKLRTISDAALDAVVMMDPQGNIAHWNPAAERMFGYAQEEIVGRNLHEVLAPERYRPLAKKGLLGFARFGEGYVIGKLVELEAVRNDGTEFPIELSVSPVQIQAHGPWWAVAIIRDITQRKHTERSLREREAHLLAAQEIQSRLWPEALETLPGYDVAGASYPAAFAGGDCFDFIPMGDGVTGFVIGDVSGHGLGTALLTALTQAHLRSLADMHTDLREILARTNRCLAKETDHFVTLFFGCLSPQSHTLRYVNAGHPLAYVLDRAGDVKRRLDNTALPLAVAAEAEFAEGEPVVLESGDMIVLLTDGVQEAFSPTDELFGIDRALQLLRANRDKTARQMIEMLHVAVREFAGEKELLDDMTAVIIKFNADA